MRVSLSEKYRSLLASLRNLEEEVAVIAFSGGVDSTFLTAAALRALGGSRVLAVTVDLPFMARRDLEASKALAREIGVRHVVLKLEFSDERIWSNPPDRCYLCKRMMLGRILEYASENLSSFAVMEATNADDLGKRRPGLRAVRELGVRSPLAEAGLTKREIRELARELGLPNWNWPATTCLATRIPYGERITLERLRRIELAEDVVRELTGVKVVRVRDHGRVARIEVGRSERRALFDERLLDELYAKLRELGYEFVALDLYGYREGSMDEALGQRP